MEKYLECLKKLKAQDFQVEELENGCYYVRYKDKEIWDKEYIFESIDELISFEKGFVAGTIIESRLEERYML